ncbi:GNAT family N-acetyltransferase [Xenorhabdus bovienii]|uniref:GNAT family N-acetyltransferase n=1 Tax=Xenorhabdus bovienii TaxID=40576 RepID=UPI0023B232EE|nr:GNAT family N-acetyltransferase [Xenorhabdus bovienii]MDE9437865.1 GNAT family N-acetyltransferase [Xenorhabdus bovienii]MDE9466904.1 GNAT family N-acetyltransferase [Xenorhabdus bovienii]MDE9499651.1 GNAT family N-acetyltransferase [Xenorhabdus bovienii]
MKIKCLHSITQIDTTAYQYFHQQARGGIFYDYRFLLALEERPLLPHLKTYYLIAQQDNELRGFLPVYLQTDVDPFGVLTASLGYPFNAETRVLFSHAMHVSDSALLHTGDPAQTLPALLTALDYLAQEERVLSYGLLNLTVGNASNIQQYASGWQNSFMWNRFSCDLRPFSGLEQIISELNAEGRREANRQLRKFNQSGGEIHWLPVSAVDLHKVTALCQQTTARNGTPHYYPPEAVRNLLQRTENFTRIVEIRQNRQLAGIGIIFIDGKKLHLWAVGMDYAVADFSPYTLLYLDIYSYALANGIETIEAGRTTQRIKERLGFNAIPLYSMTKRRGTCV